MRILVVDDDAIARELIGASLEESGHAVETSGDGAQARARLSAGGIDLVISDWTMPGMDGVELCRAVRAEAREYVYFVLLTARSAVVDVVAGLAAGADDFIAKPFDPIELDARVQSICRLKELHDQVARQNQELRRTQRLKDDWTKMIVHDLRSPLLSILGYCELAALKARSLVGRELGIVQQESQRINEMLEQMLLTAKSDEGRLRPQRVETDLVGLARSALRALEAVALARRVRLELRSDERLAIQGDPSLLRRLIDNLLTNALKFSPPDARVSVEIRRDADHAALAVLDEGPGVPAAAVPRLFEKYETAELRQLGVPQHGLGLAFCRLVTAAHGGVIHYEPGVERGSRFEARLPIGDPVADEPERREEAREPLLVG